MEGGAGAKLIKLLLFVFNLFFLLCGMALLAIGIWTAIDRVYLSRIIGTVLYETAGYMLIAIGIVVVVISILGCCGSIFENKCLMISYFVFLVVIFVILLVGSILAVAFRADLENLMKKTMNDSLINQYDHFMHPDITDAWNMAQRMLNCCAVVDSGWEDYRASFWFKQQNVMETEKIYVPKSCCARNYDGTYANLDYCQKPSGSMPPKTKLGSTNLFLYYDGCFTKGFEMVSAHGWVIFSVAFVIALVMILGMIGSISFVRMLEWD
ncbi:CD151 antigen [Lingula anatina]|uniref:Tetraspanin n=1 Tax=Lingula anatina TaxID=7574 RepID=A0A1S3K3Z0_LINAN|nr:CD151 antigen [Lingula anatina]|eukprot:XP_013417129.2 CD151 antigen [Lingula anatina]